MSESHERLRENHHRRQREAFIRDATPSLAVVLEASECLTGIAVESWLGNIPFPSFQNNKPTTTIGDIPGSAYSDWDDWNHASASLLAITDTPDVDANLYLSGGPIWRIALSQYSNLIGDILTFSDSHQRSDFAWVSLDRKHGVSISSYCGYLPEDRRTNRDEVVHEILHWGI